MVTPWFPTGDDPVAGRFVWREVSALAALHDVRVLHLDWQRMGTDLDAADLPAEVTRVPLDRRRPSDFARARRAVRSAARGAEVVHTHALTGLLPWADRRVHDGPWVHTEHWSGLSTPATLSLPQRAIRRLLLPSLARPDVVVAESRILFDAVREHRRGPIALVPCVVPRAPLVERPRGPRLRLVAVGGLIPRKGPLEAVDMVADLVTAGHDVALTWVGGGPLHEQVREHADRLSVGDRVDLVGAQDDAGVRRHLQAADMFVLPTRGENFSVVVAEALVAGRPVVSGVPTGAVDYAPPAVSRFVEEHTGPAYAEAVSELAAATSELSAADVAATVGDAFSPAHVAEALTAVYRQATG